MHENFMIIVSHLKRNKCVIEARNMWEKRVKVMVFNATFNNISAISWWPVLLVEETGVPG